MYIYVYILVCLFQDINANNAIDPPDLSVPHPTLAILYYYQNLS